MKYLHTMSVVVLGFPALDNTTCRSLSSSQVSIVSIQPEHQRRTQTIAASHTLLFLCTIVNIQIPLVGLSFNVAIVT